MSDDVSSRRPTRRNRTTRPIEAALRGRVQPNQVRYTPISPDELAMIIDIARTERIETDIAEYARRKAS